MLLKLPITLTLTLALLVLGVSALQEAGDTKAEFRLIKRAAAAPSPIWNLPHEHEMFVFQQKMPMEYYYPSEVWAIDVELLSDNDRPIRLATQMAGDHTGAVNAIFSTPYFAQQEGNPRNVMIKVTEWSFPTAFQNRSKILNTFSKNITCRLPSKPKPTVHPVS